MKTHHTSLFLSYLFTLLLQTSLSQSQDDEYYKNCSARPSCGNISNLGYPFWGTGRAGYCGGRQGLELDCHEDEDGNHPVLSMGTLEYRVLDINTATLPIIRMARTDLWEGTCLQNLTNTRVDYTIFSNSASTRNLTIFYNCSQSNYSIPYNFSCGPQIGYYADESLMRIKLPAAEDLACTGRISVPILSRALDELTDERITLEEALNGGFELIYPPERRKCSVCESTGGECGSNLSSSEFLCLCSHGHYPDYCPAKKGNGINWIGKLSIAAASVFASITIMLVLGCLYLRRKKIKDSSLLLSRNLSYDPSSRGEFEKSNGVHLFSYYELEEATNNFDSSKELGDGGFGTVYYGKLKDGRVVAVKRLYEHNFKRVEQFLNEVEILARLRHKHLVSLYGCTSRHSRELLLVYEYVSNGTVADHLHGARAKPGNLPWHTRMKIAVETATALSYLHASDIIHRDVKTHNILLDENFSVKVADFGLSRLFPTDVTHISTAPQGTPGYVDPDYHQCYQLTDKSDVYSFGVVLIELISSKPAVDIARHRYEINLANLAINKITNKALDELVDPDLGFGSDSRVREMVEAVAELAFGCLQGEKDSRPSMAEAMECLCRIQSNESWNEKKIMGEEVIVSDGVVLLKSTDTLSPDSTFMNWSTSTDTTPTASM